MNPEGDPMKARKHGVDRQAISVVSLQEMEAEDKRYWRGKSPHERLEAVETIRQVLYGYDPAAVRLQRVLEIVERA